MKGTRSCNRPCSADTRALLTVVVLDVYTGKLVVARARRRVHGRREVTDVACTAPARLHPSVPDASHAHVRSCQQMNGCLPHEPSARQSCVSATGIERSPVTPVCCTTYADACCPSCLPGRPPEALGGAVCPRPGPHRFCDALPAVSRHCQLPYERPSRTSPGNARSCRARDPVRSPVLGHPL